MRLMNARLCLDCEEVHDEQHCPICGSESFAFLTRWVSPSDTVAAKRRLAARARLTTRWIDGNKSMPIDRSSIRTTRPNAGPYRRARRAGAGASRSSANHLARHAGATIRIRTRAAHVPEPTRRKRQRTSPHAYAATSRVLPTFRSQGRPCRRGGLARRDIFEVFSTEMCRSQPRSLLRCRSPERKPGSRRPRTSTRRNRTSKLGREAAAEVRKQYPIINDAAIARYLDRLGDRLVAAAPAELNKPVYQYSFTPVNLKEINAFALPGGPMFVHAA